ncbi:MAG: hypothetical protein RIF41_35770 [Polyangiaceae bacterium]
MLHPDPDAPDTRRSVLMTLLASVLVVGGFVLLFTNHDTATVAMPEPEPPADMRQDQGQTPVFPTGMAALAAEDALR